MSRFVSVVVSSFVAVVLNVVVAVPAFAQDPPAAEPAASPPPVAAATAAAPAVFDQPGFDLGARLGYALPFGNTSGSEKLSEGTTGHIPVVIEIGYRLNANITVAALVQYGLSQIKENATTGCGGAVSCSGSVIRLGAEAIYNLNLGTALSPWLGIGAGYEWFNSPRRRAGRARRSARRGSSSSAFTPAATTASRPTSRWGRSLSFSLGQYASASIEGGGCRRAWTSPTRACTSGSSSACAAASASDEAARGPAPRAHGISAGLCTATQSRRASRARRRARC